MTMEAGKQRFEAVTESPQETIALGTRIGRALRGGEVFCLVGPLGSGKTHLIKGICDGAGVEDEDQVTSPTFVLVNEYFAPAKGLEIHHLDAYRLESIAEFETLGFDDLCHPGAVVLIEWADKVERAMGSMEVIHVQMGHAGSSQRRVVITGMPEDMAAGLGGGAQ